MTILASFTLATVLSFCPVQHTDAVQQPAEPSVPSIQAVVPNNPDVAIIESADHGFDVSESRLKWISGIA